MVGSSKILTVSYGTFSCTLEGFDDPFSTMRSIAEYFRDLAADDRYFGAEPPTPDAEMLHRIAEREVQRRVEARVQSDSIVLRQVGEAEGDADSPAASAAAAAAISERVTAAQAEAAADAAAAAPEAQAEPPAASAAAAQEAPVEAAETPEPETPVEAIYAESATPADHPADAPEMEAPDAAPEAPRHWDHALSEATGAEEPSGYAEDEEHAASAEGQAEAATDHPAARDLPGTEDTSVAAKLSRIRAVVSGGAPGPVAPADRRFTGSIQAAFDDAGTIDDADFEDVTEPQEEPVEEETAAAEADAGQPDADAAAEADAGQPDADTAAEAEAPESDDGASSLAARVVRLKRTAQELSEHSRAATLTSSLSEADEADEADLAPEMAEAEHQDAEAPVDHAALAEAAADASTEDSDEPVVEPEDTQAASAEAHQAHEAEDDQARNTAGLAPDTDDEAPHDDARAEADDSEEHAVAMGRHPGFDTAKTEDAAFDRILEQTNSRMDDSEGSRRRSAIAHLKAAVAATKADRLLKRLHPDEAEEQSQYRDDLAKVVQPQRPFTQPRDAAGSQAVPEAAKAGTPAPLVLVSEQRVDTAKTEAPDAAEEAAAAVSEPDDTAEEGFAAFVSKMGATELPDLLEAAAAYTAFVEGNKLFSRPDLMRRVAHMEMDEDFTREAGLRSFGQLLRQGKIQKLKRGQFTISEETRFNPQARLAGE